MTVPALDVDAVCHRQLHRGVPPVLYDEVGQGGEPGEPEEQAEPGAEGADGAPPRRQAGNRGSGL